MTLGQGKTWCVIYNWGPKGTYRWAWNRTGPVFRTSRIFILGPLSLQLFACKPDHSFVE